jgi:hypothetical protein
MNSIYRSSQHETAEEAQRWLETQQDTYRNTRWEKTEWEMYESTWVIVASGDTSLEKAS